MTIFAKAPGKCILFGEHAVVYGFSAISFAINLFSTCKIKKQTQKGINLILRNQNFSEYYISLEMMKIQIPQKYKQIPVGLVIFKEKYHIKIDNISIELYSELWEGAGLGSSASIAVALSYALNLFYNLSLSKKEISQMAYEYEKVVHGSPSGIDNEICTFGGIIKFKGKTIESFKAINLPLLIIYSNEIHNTKQAISNVLENKLHNPEKVNKIFSSIGTISEEGIKSLLNQDINKLKYLMKKNQFELNELGLCTKNIREILNIAKKYDDIGIKITGAGMGGCLVAIGNIQQLENLSLKLNKIGYRTIFTSINSSGVKGE